MNTIGKKTRLAIVESITALLREKMFDINEAYEAEGELSIGLSVKMGNQTPKGVQITVQMQFIKEKIKTAARFQVDENQVGLFNFDHDSGVDSVTLQTGESDPVTIYERPHPPA